jgi:predicted dehydrogenase
VNVAVVGYGYWGPNLVRNFWKNSNFEVTHVVDQQKSRLNTVKHDYPTISITTNFQDILKNSSIDCVVIATPVHTHYQLAKQALKYGKHVLIEKPLSDSFRKAKELVELSKKSKRVLLVDNTYLYTSAIQKISKIINEKKFGEIQYIDSTRINLGKFQTDVNVLWDLATHDISICLHLLKETPLYVQSIGKSHTKSGIADIAYLTLHYRSKKIAHFNCSWISPVKIRHMLIGGTKKMIMFNDLESTEKVKVYDSSYTQKTKPGNSNNFLTDYRIGDVFVPKLDLTEGLSNLVSDFALAIKSNKTPISNNKISLMTVKILESAEKSLKNNGKMIKL